MGYKTRATNTLSTYVSFDNVGGSVAPHVIGCFAPLLTPCRSPNWLPLVALFGCCDTHKTIELRCEAANNAPRVQMTAHSAQ